MYRERVNAFGVVVRPRMTLAAIAGDPRLGRSFLVVLLSGIVSAAIGVAAGVLASSGGSAVVASLVVPGLFVAYWLLEAWLVDAGAAMLGRSGHRRAFLGVTGYVFVPWIAYALLTLIEAAAQHAGGSSSALAAALAWLTLPVLCWFLALTVLAIRAVYELPALNALALALLPYATIAAAVLLVTVGLSIAHGA